MRGIDDNTCPLCGKYAWTRDCYPPNAEYLFTYIVCTRCGKFTVSESAAIYLIQDDWSKKEASQISAFTREQTILNALETAGQRQNPWVPLTHISPHAPAIPGVVSLKEALNAFPKNISEQIDRTLANLSRLAPGHGSVWDCPQDDYPVAFAENVQGRNFILSYLLKQELIEREIHARTITSDWIKLTVKGWERLGDRNNFKTRIPSHLTIHAGANANVMIGSAGASQTLDNHPQPPMPSKTVEERTDL